MTPHEAQELRDLAAAIVAQGGEEAVTPGPVNVEHPVAEDEAAAPPAPAEQCPVPVSRFQEMGRARTPVKAERARENGRRGGRPRKWSREVLGMVAAWIRRELEAGTVHVFNEKEELQHLAQALEAGKVR